MSEYVMEDVYRMRVDQKILVTCDVCQTLDLIRIENLLDHQCKHCATSALEIKHDEKERVIKEIDDAVDKLDSAIGSAMYGFMSSKEARDWIEHEANNISDALNKAREYINDLNDKN